MNSARPVERPPAPSARRAIRCACLALALAGLVTIPTRSTAHEDPGVQVVEITRRIAERPDDATLYLRRADLYRSRREWSAGIADLQTARRLDPRLDTVDFALARLLLDAGTPGPALEACDRFVAARPDHSGIHLLRARVLVALDRRMEAVSEFTRGIDLAKRPGSAPAQPDDYLERARLLACPPIGDVGSALRGLDEGLAALRGAVALQMFAVDLEVERRDWDGALARIAAVEQRANRKEAWIARRGDVLALAGRRDEADRAYEQALATIDRLPRALRTSEASTKVARQARERRANPSAEGWVRLSGEAGCPEPSRALDR